MGLFDIIFGRRPKPKGDHESVFRLLNGYTPHFTTWGGSIYESELIRAVIGARATHISKLRVETMGAARPALQGKLRHGPNRFQTWSQFMYRLSTILDIHNTAFIVPVYDDYGEPSGIYAPLPNRCTIVQYDNVPYLRYEFSDGNRAAVELAYCGIMTKFQYKDDFFGESNHALYPTMDLIHTQTEGIQEGIKSAASYKFMARVGNFSKTEDLKRERQRFTEDNFSKESDPYGVLLFPNTYNEIKQIDIKPWVIDADQMKIIENGVYDYFTMNEDVLQGKAYGDKWTAFYESAIEPFAIQFSEVVTKMLFTLREQTQGNKVMATANRLQYLSNKEKLEISQGMLDRGIFNRDEVREIWNLPPLPNGEGQQYVIRGEYWSANEKINEDNTDETGT